MPGKEAALSNPPKSQFLSWLSLAILLVVIPAGMKLLNSHH